MNKKLFVLAALLFLMISICAVSAENINQTDDNMKIYYSDTLSGEESCAGSFSDLSKEIDESTGELNIKSDYKFNISTDENYKNGIAIVIDDDSRYTINGNNHVIDADNNAGIFKFINGTVVINNLKITNAKGSSIILNNCELYTNNVTFEGNHANSVGGAVYAEGSNYYSNQDNFINNYAKYGAAIYGDSSIIEIDNSKFISDDAVHWSLIHGDNCIMLVNNTVFTNITSRYATAIYSEGNKLTVLNSKFINLYANATAGAIGCKGITSLIIDNSSFINVTSAKNAGAVYADLNAKAYNPTNSATITNTLFENCYSNFGGAYVQLGGILNLVNDDFTNNVAEYSGGAAYLSNATVLIGNSKFDKNTAKVLYGGALCIDDSNSLITACNFIDNFAGTYGDAVYLYDSKYEIKNSKFTKGLQEAIVSFFYRQGSSLNNNELNGGKPLLNQTAYNTIVEYKGKEIILNVTSTANASVNDAKFDLRDYKVNGTNISLAGVVKNQGSNSACWAFGGVGALESAFLKATGILLDLSENNIQDSGIHYNLYGADNLYEGGYTTSGMGLLLSWLGVISTEFDSYDELGKIGLALFVPGESYHIQDTLILPEYKNAADMNKFKEALIKYGALAVPLYGAASDNEYYNPATHAQYYTGNTSNHVVTLVGWDDNYSKDNFRITPPGDGAWIIKNSWGTEWGENGYFYVSYYDTTFARYSESVGYIISPSESYTTVYQYDIGEYDTWTSYNGKDMYFANTYTAIDNELLKAVGTYFSDANDEYKISIFVDGAIVYTQTGKSTHRGFETIKLDKPIAISKDSEFSVGIRGKTMYVLEDTRIHLESEKSIALYPNKTVEDLGKEGKTACVKAYTVANPNPDVSKSQYYRKNSNLTIYSNAEGRTISIYNNSKKLGAATVADGKASFNFVLEPGKYSSITSYDEGDIIEEFEIMNTIEIPDSIKIGYNTELSIKVKFYDENGVELFYCKNITVKLDSKTYMAEIENNEGILLLELSELTMGKHTLVLKNPETLEEKTTTIEVVSRFSGNSNVDMLYADGSGFKVLVYDNYGNPVSAGESVTMKLNKVTYDIKTNSNGYAILTIPNTVTVGTYTLTATYAGQTIKNTVKVKQDLKLAKVTVKKSAKKLVIKATLKGKKPISGKTLTFKFNGKKYSAKTNKNGIAQITIKKSVLSKLKVGKKVTYQVTYLKNTVKQTVKVKS